jgi:Zn finger protein HypA/HybF involved in hydrogenase expression
MKQYEAFCHNCKWSGSDKEVISRNPPNEPHFWEYLCPKCGSTDIEFERDAIDPDQPLTTR